jgi:1-acyl-sn-glycerol-3-phosphate acyltransferase
MPAAAPALLAVSHPPSFLDALILVASHDGPVRCLVPRRVLRGAWRRFLARRLGMIPYDPEAQGSGSVLEASCEVLARREALAVFADSAGSKAREVGQLGREVATLALEAEARHSGRLELAIFPIHLFCPKTRSQGDLLVYVDAPIDPQEYLGREAGVSPGGARALAERIEMASEENAFRLQPQGLKQFLADLEETLRSELEEDWASRPGWKQKVEGFELSRFVADWTEQINHLDPGQLVALREAVAEYREGRRRWSLDEFYAEAGGEWLRLPWRRLLIWVESAIGLPVAVFGLVNHLLAWLLLSWFGLLKKEQASKTDWLLRTLVVLGCYTGQVLLCAGWLGRAVAGYYAPSLPLAGCYLWRYDWLVRERTRRALAVLRHPTQAAKLRRKRKKLIDELDRALQLQAETPGVAH